MNFPLTLGICFGIFVGFTAQGAGSVFNCKEGEEYYSCRSPCQPSCDSLTNGFRGNCSGPCIGGCFCRNGLVRNVDNTCVTPEECFRPECQENEEYNECGSACELNCTNYEDGMFCTKPCYSGCFCKQDYVRDQDRRCVDPSSCNVDATQQCGVNEHYVNCVSFCNTCWELNYCKTPYCRPGCDCKPGFYKDYYGQCVSESQCYSSLYDKCQENEIFLKCGPSCRSTCQNYRNILYDSCKRDCVPGCHCEGNLVLGPDGKCIRPEFCPQDQPVKCPVNEKYYTCVPSCRHTCETYNDPKAKCDTPCFEGCFCKDGLVRRSDGACVPPHECPVLSSDPPCPPSEVYYQCKPTCRTTCQSLNSTKSVCPLICEAGCFCQPGLVQDDVGVCVRPDECTVPAQPCPAGEVYYNCRPTCRTTCENVNFTGPCPRICISGCACPNGFVKRMDGICVRPGRCIIECGPNEEYDMCGSACIATCNNPNPICTESRCIKGCFCKDGFVFGPDGTCIPRSDCPRRNPPSTPNPCNIISGRSAGSNSTENTTNSTETSSVTTVADTTVAVTTVNTSESSTSSETMTLAQTLPSTLQSDTTLMDSNSTSSEPDVTTSVIANTTITDVVENATSTSPQTETSAPLNVETVAMTTNVIDTTINEDNVTETAEVVNKRKENLSTAPISTVEDTTNVTVTETTTQS